jgi:hypothetical protein
MVKYDIALFRITGVRVLYPDAGSDQLPLIISKRLIGWGQIG